jgi:HD-GYP domain-containing protein (c-di-GMP phosphodiesterase class II)
LPNPIVSGRHGRILRRDGDLAFEDLHSTNGSMVIRQGGEALPVLPGPAGTRLEVGDEVQVGNTIISAVIESGWGAMGEPGRDVTVILTRPPMSGKEVSQRLGLSIGAGVFLGLVQDTAAHARDESALLDAIGSRLLEAFDQATHLTLALRDPQTQEVRPVLFRARNAEDAPNLWSRTVTEAVMAEGMAMLFCRGDRVEGAESLQRLGVDTAISAPLSGVGDTFGVVQLDVRKEAGKVLGTEDLDRLTAFATHIGFALDNLRLHQEQQRAFESTVAALVHSLSLKDEETARHCQRVQTVSLRLAEHIELDARQMEILSVAALVHDLGKQGVRDDLLWKPGRLTDDERQEFAEHAHHTEDILTHIAWPQHLQDVPMVAAYHHERMDGAGTYRIPGEEIPLLARIISVADVFDALATPRAYKRALSYPEICDIFREGVGTQWDGDVVAVLFEIGPSLMASVYAGLHPQAKSTAEGRRRDLEDAA